MFLEDYENHVKERAALGVPPLALNATQVTKLTSELKATKDTTHAERLATLLESRVSPGVDEAAKVKAEFLGEILDGLNVPAIDKFKAIKMLSLMLGGYNVPFLVAALSNTDAALASAAATALKSTIFVHDEFAKVAELSHTNAHALDVVKSWAEAEWFLSRPKVPDVIKGVVFKVSGETNTDDLSPASEAWSRADIPLHANSMLVRRLPGALNTLNELKQICKNGEEVIFVGDVVGTGSSRKSGINSIAWHIGREMAGIPNKKTGGVVVGTTIAPIFFNTAQDSGTLPLEADVSNLETGECVEIHLHKGEILKNGECVAKFALRPVTLLDEIRAGGRIALIVGRNLTAKAREFLGLGESELFVRPTTPKHTGGYTLAQKMVGRACGKAGVAPGEYCEPRVTTVGSQDTTGPMTRDEVKELAALKFGAEFVLQSFCHTAAYPKPVDSKLHESLPKFITSRGGVALRPKDGVIHSWLNRFVLPDSVGTGGDSHTRFPLGVSFPAGSGLVAFAAVSGVMPLDMPQSVLVRFKGTLQSGVTLRDLVNAIPLVAIKRGLLSVAKKGKKNIFAGRILEIEGLENLSVEQAFELSDASAERSAAACVVNLSKASVAKFLRSNIALCEKMIRDGYTDASALEKRAQKMREWLEKPNLLRADSDASYEEVLEIDLNEICEPVLACPNDPDDVATLSEVLASQNRPKNIDEVFVGSCMTNIGHYRALGEILRGKGSVPVRLWVVPPTKMDEEALRREGVYSLFGAAGARTEVPGCSLCMGNQARVADGAVVFSTSTRNFDNRMGLGAKVYLGSAELAGVCATLGRLPEVAEYREIYKAALAGKEEATYRYLQFDSEN